MCVRAVRQGRQRQQAAQCYTVRKRLDVSKRTLVAHPHVIEAGGTRFLVQEMRSDLFYAWLEILINRRSAFVARRRDKNLT